MPKYICCYYTCKLAKDVSKDNKKVVVINTDDHKILLSIENELKINKKAKHIKYIRDMDKETKTPYYRNDKLVGIENVNNWNLK